ncbi:hypothetical protein G5I_07006 [Acromyrmex echinatior]|uniref:Uncharacterized protein n=1 Tax=Acromyrmex echinatior TaxID=103372 RepID=F4WMM3_ACREC|nr:hypothetical protein G5I_07006 [Acromyrmex echinatior]
MSNYTQHGVNLTTITHRGEIDVSPSDEDSEPRIILRFGPQHATAGITMANPTVRVYHFYSPGTVTVLSKLRPYENRKCQAGRGGTGSIT